MSFAAKRFATAFYDVAIAAGAWEKVFQDIKQLSHWGTYPEFASFCSNALIPQHQAHQVIIELCKASKFHPLTQSFLCVVVDHRRLGQLQVILTEVLKLQFEHSNCMIAEVTSAHKLSALALQGLEDMMTERFKKKIFMNSKLSPAVIGGVCIRIGSYLYDATLKHQLTQLSNNLKEA